MKLKQIPNLVYADADGNIFDSPALWMSGRSGNDFVSLSPDDFIELPEGSDLYHLEGRRPIGFEKETGEPKVFKEGFAVGAQMAPAHTMFYIAAYEKEKDAPTLPLFAYTAVGWLDGKFYVPAVRIDKDIRQEPAGFDRQMIERNVAEMLKEFPGNRLLEHIGNNCALTYNCPAARNHFMHRWEAPVPTSPACNSNCIGCISFQPTTETIPSTQDRLTFKPTPQEIIEYGIPHLQNAPTPVLSFGQGCEGEPLLMWEVIRDAIKEIRSKTNKGSININSNGSMPNAVEELCKAGLNSIRVSLNSVRENIYNAYYLPNNYKFDALKESIKVIRKHNGWASINYFVFPGVTDEVEEYEALRKFIRETDLTMIQWRNFNIDPDWYLRKIKYTPSEKVIGVKKMLELIHEEFPHIMFGYFNPPMNIIKEKLIQKSQAL
ncbi:MAG TPA: radical SAM protein [Bacteroidetes bacterium]|nr:radical SAM protein [Bacteroidota bacterium]